MEWSSLADTMQQFGVSVYDTFRSFLSLLNTSLIDLITLLSNSIGDGYLPPKLLEFLNELLFGSIPLGDLPLWAFMLGGGVTFVCIYSLAKWIIDIIA